MDTVINSFSENYLTRERLVKIQTSSALLFLPFLLLHLTNTVLAVFGAGTYNEFQQVIRLFYQNPIVELSMVIAPLVTHLVVGVVLYVRARHHEPQRLSLVRRLHRWAGFFLLVVIFGHIAATRGIGFFMGAPPGFEGISFSFLWMPEVFYPYYFLLFMAGFYHSSYGLNLLMAKTKYVKHQQTLTPPRLGAIFIAAVMICLALLAFDGQLFEIHDPTDNAYARVYSELIGIKLNDLQKP